MDWLVLWRSSLCSCIASRRVRGEKLEPPPQFSENSDQRIVHGVLYPGHASLRIAASQASI
jgi:hypothetical protein